MAAYTLANGLLYTVPKEDIGTEIHGEALASLEKAAANIIAAQPKEVQEGLLNQVAGYLASQKEMGLSATQLAADLTKRVGELAPVAVAKEGSADQWQRRTATMPEASVGITA